MTLSRPKGQSILLRIAGSTVAETLLNQISKSCCVRRVAHSTYQCCIRVTSQRFTITAQNAQHLKNVVSDLLSKN
jgi:hypothetical protein